MSFLASLASRTAMGHRSVTRQAPLVLPSFPVNQPSRHIAATALPVDLLPRFVLPFRQNTIPWSTNPISLPSINASTCAGTSTNVSVTVGDEFMEGLKSFFEDLSSWFIKRTFQPSIIRKRRKHGFLRRKESVGGRRVLKRRMAKGRARLGGS